MRRLLEPGPLAPRLEWIGHAAVCLYVVTGRRPLLIDAGLTAMGPLVLAELGRVLGDPGKLQRVLLTHSHYDHISTVPALRQAVPGLKVAAHPRVGEIVARPGAVALIRRLNETVLGGPPPVDDPTLRVFEPFPVDEPLADGDRIELGDGVTVEVLATPGHTQDSLSYYLPHARAVICGEAAGVPGLDGTIMPEFLQDYEAYVTSLERLAGLDLDIIGLPHNGVLTGPEARAYMQASLTATHAFHRRLGEALDAAHGDPEPAFGELMRQLYSSNVGQPPDAFAINLRAMLRQVAAGSVPAN